jgi:hypothetical protein
MFRKALVVAATVEAVILAAGLASGYVWITRRNNHA